MFNNYTRMHTAALCLAAALLASGTATLVLEDGFADDARGYVSAAESLLLVAHRAGAYDAPENTLAALNLAIASDAEIAEIDIRQTQDNVLVALHDETMKRTAGIDVPIADVCYDALMDVDAGAYYSEDFTGEPIPTLEQLLQAAKGRIALMLDLKPDGTGSLETETLELISRYEMEEQCSIASTSASLLAHVKELAPEIMTIYITNSMSRHDYGRDYVDAFSIKVNSLTPTAVKRIHSLGKTVFGWTANKKSDIHKILRCGGDGIITDNVTMVSEMLHPGTAEG